MKIELEHVILMCIGLCALAMVTGIVPLTVYSTTEVVKPEAYNYWGVVDNYHLMDDSAGYGTFQAGKAGWVKFRNVNDPFTKAEYADGYISFKLHYADVSSNGQDARLILQVYKDSDPSAPAGVYHFFLNDFDGKSHWTTKTTTDKLSKYDTDGDGVINYAVLMHRDDFNDWVRVYDLQYRISFDEPTPDPCIGVSCPDMCIGDYWGTNGACDNGNCVYDKNLVAGKCGHIVVVDKCTGVDCSSYCDGTTFYYNGLCDNGICEYRSDTDSVNCQPAPPIVIDDDSDDDDSDDDNDDAASTDNILLFGGGLIALLLVVLFALRSKK